MITAAFPSASHHKHQERLHVLLLNYIFSVRACVCEHLWQVSILIFTSLLGDIAFSFAERRVLKENQIELPISSSLHEFLYFDYWCFKNAGGSLYLSVFAG